MHPIKISKIRTSRTELIDISKAWIAISFAFAVIYTGASLLNGSIQNIITTRFLLFFVIALFTAGLGFLLHELAHKFVAQRYGCAAEFRAWDQFLYLAVGLAVLVGFIFAAPGAVMISGMVTRKENGHISVAGPLTNYILAFIFLGLLYLFPAWNLPFSIGFSINMWLGLFNLIPFGPLDGLKIFHWNKIVWTAMAVIGILFVFVL
ncbi:metalloprotease [Candidatus Woesearchaeota archaeon]|nr:metalloprotease [Candidatus Woesearchaeota archaeon]